MRLQLWRSFKFYNDSEPSGESIIMDKTLVRQRGEEMTRTKKPKLRWIIYGGYCFEASSKRGVIGLLKTILDNNLNHGRDVIITEELPMPLPKTTMRKIK